MHPLVVLLLVAIAAYVGHIWPWAGTRIKNTKRHRSADSEYVLIYMDGEAHAFTDEACEVARKRAQKLKIQ